MKNKKIVFKIFIIFNYSIHTFQSQFRLFSVTVKFNKSYNNIALKVEKYVELHVIRCFITIF